MAAEDLIPWWGWLLLWTGLVLAAAVLLGALVWGLVRRGLAVVAEAGTAGARAGELMSRVESLSEATRPAPAVLEDPALLRRQRADRQRAARRVRARAVAARREAVRRAGARAGGVSGAGAGQAGAVAAPNP